METRMSEGETPINVWFYVGGSIGVTLLGLHVLETAYISLCSPKSRFFLVYNKPQAIYRQMLALYPYVEIIDISENAGMRALSLILKTGPHRNIFLYPPAFGRPPLWARCFSFFLTLKRGVTVGFSNSPSISDRVFYNHVLPIEYEKNIFTSVREALGHLIRLKETTPELLYEHDVEFKKKLPSQYVVFHPYASGEKRTYPDSLSRKLLKYICDSYPDYALIISGGPANTERAKKLIESVGEGYYILDLNPENSFQKTMQIVAGASLYVGVDTGNTHLAVHLHTPTIVLGNRNAPMWFTTYGHSSQILTNVDKCCCTGDKQGDCVARVDGKEYLGCLVHISWQKITSIIQSYLS